MERKVNQIIKGMIHVEKITNEPFDDIIGHSDSERKYFNIENNDIIYKRLKSELLVKYLPYLGPCVDFGLGDICLEESNGIFKFYIIDRTLKHEYEEFDKIEKAIQRLIAYYKEYELVDNPDIMEEIFNQTLGLKKEKDITVETCGPIKILKPNHK